MNECYFIQYITCFFKIPNKYWKIYLKDKKDFYKLKECIEEYYKRISVL